MPAIGGARAMGGARAIGGMRAMDSRRAMGRILVIAVGGRSAMCL